MLNPYYITGFVDGEGCFSITLNKKSTKLPEVRLFFEIELREDDRQILEKIQQVLDCGAIYHLNYVRYEKWRPHVKLKVGSFKDICEKVIPFFKKYPLQAKKSKQFEIFCVVAEMMKRNKHKTLTGIEEITLLRANFRKA